MVAEALAGAAPLFSLLRASDGRLLASGEGSAQARAWWLGPGAGYLAVVETDRLMRVFEPRRRALLATLPHTERIAAVLPLNNALITADSRGVIRHWQWPKERGDLRVRRVGITRAPESLSAAGNRLAYQAMDYSVAVRRLPEGSPVVVRPGVGVPLELELSADGGALASRTADVLRIWQLPPSDGEPHPLAAVASLALDAGADEAVVGDWDGHLRTVSRADPTLGMARDDLGLEYIGHNGPITAVAMDSGRGIAASGGSDGVVRLWDLQSGAPTASFLRHPQGPIQDLTLSEDGRFVASAAEYAARVWDAADGRLLAEVPVNGAAMAVAFVPGSEQVLTGDSAGNVLIAELGAPDRVQALLAAGPVTALAVAHDGRQFAVGGAGGSVEWWRLSDGSPSGSLSFPSPIRRLSFNPDGQHMLVETVGWYHRVDLAGPNPRLADSRLAPLGAASQAAQLDSGGRTLRVVTAGSRLEFRDLDMGRPNAAPVEGEPAALRKRWQRAAGLLLDRDGLVQPLSLARQAGAAPDAESVN
jgi:WD40 repeat protein